MACLARVAPRVSGRSVRERRALLSLIVISYRNAIYVLRHRVDEVPAAGHETAALGHVLELGTRAAKGECV